jgi:hypothetical protein
MGKDFRNHLLRQLEMLRGAVSHQELSRSLGARAEGCLARYVAGKTHLQEKDFYRIARAVRIDPRNLARQWARSLGLGVTESNAVSDILDRAYCDYLGRKRTSGVPPHPSPMSVIRLKYADRLSRQAPPLCFASHGATRITPKGRLMFVRAYEMLVEFVHDKRCQRDIGAQRGLSGERARQLMQRAAYTWAKSEGIDLYRAGSSISWKNEARLVRNLYAGLRFFSRYRVGSLARQDHT